MNKAILPTKMNLDFTINSSPFDLEEEDWKHSPNLIYGSAFYNRLDQQDAIDKRLMTCQSEDFRFDPPGEPSSVPFSLAFKSEFDGRSNLNGRSFNDRS